MKVISHFIIILFLMFIAFACASDVVSEKTVSSSKTSSKALDDLGEKERAKIAEIKAANKKEDPSIKNVLKGTTTYSVSQYLAYNPKANDPSSQVFSVGAYDLIDIIVYEESELSRPSIQISADGYISFPLIGRIKVEGLTTSEIEKYISDKLADGKYLREAHVSVMIREFKSKKYSILGSVKNPGSYTLQAKERLLEAISKAGGIEFEQGAKQVMIIRTEHSDTNRENKIVINIDQNVLLRGEQNSNILLSENDLIYVPKAESFHIMGQVRNPGSYPYLEKEISIVEAISKAGGFTQVAARNRTRIVRVEDGVEKIIQIKIDEITDAGKKGMDIKILPGDVIVIPESYF